MSTEQLTLDGVPGRRILRLYNLYRVIIGLALVLLISSDLDDQLLELAHAQLFRYGSWTYLILNVLVAVLLQRPSHLAQVFSLALLDVLLLCTLFFAAGGTPSGIGNLLIVAVAIANILLRGRIGLLIAAVAAIGLTGASIDQAVDIFAKIYKCYMDTDASLVEINPLNCDSKGNLMALDAKFNFDANALFRHPEIVAYRDLDEEDPAEVEASKFDLAYISLDGNIGCLVNGAGLAMATMDTIKLFGGEPANFLDVGGGATPEKVTEAFKIMLKNPKVKGILVNIFGGIMKCDTIATGVITACKAVNLNVPLVVRMKGTNEELGKKMLAESGLPIIAADTMAEAATKIVAAVK